MNQPRAPKGVNPCAECGDDYVGLKKGEVCDRCAARSVRPRVTKGDVERVYAWQCKVCRGTAAFIAKEGSNEVPERYLGCPACGACAMARGVESGR